MAMMMWAGNILVCLRIQHALATQSNALIISVNAESSGSDFIAVMLSKGRLSTDFSLGSVIVSFTAPDLVNDNRWHLVSVWLDGPTA